MAYPLGPKDNPDLRRLYEVEGLTLRQVAKHFGVSYQAVHDRLLRMGVTLRSRGNRRNAFERDLLYRLYVTDGLTVAEVAAKLNVTPHVVTRDLKHHGIPRRRTSTRPEEFAQKAKA